VSGGELKVSRQVGLPQNLRAPPPKPEMASLYFLAAVSVTASVEMIRPSYSNEDTKDGERERGLVNEA
jgi:hypothetical protein